MSGAWTAFAGILAGMALMGAAGSFVVWRLLRRLVSSVIDHPLHARARDAVESEVLERMGGPETGWVSRRARRAGVRWALNRGSDAVESAAGRVTAPAGLWCLGFLLVAVLLVATAPQPLTAALVAVVLAGAAVAVAYRVRWRARRRTR